jgi:hypothetical protein
MARFNESAVKRPELQELPALPEGAKTDEATSNSENSSDAAGAVNRTDDGEPSAAGGGPAELSPQVNEEAVAPAEQSEAAQETEAKGDADTAAESTEEGKNQAQEAAEGESSAKDKELEKIIADRKRIEADNQRKLDVYQELLTKGRDNVKELNLRFGDWFFVVDNEMFTKLRLSADDVIKKKEAKTDEEKKDDVSAAGAPGTAIPGLPPLPGK